MTYLRSINPSYEFLGNTGANPEKAEALGAIPREGGERVSMICEVRAFVGGYLGTVKLRVWARGTRRRRRKMFYFRVLSVPLSRFS